MSDEKLNVSIPATGERLELEAKRLNLVCFAADFPYKLEYEPQYEVIDSFATVQHTNSVEKFQPETHKLFEYAISDRYAEEPQPDHYTFEEFVPNRLKQEGIGYQHLAGLLDKIVLAVKEERQFVLRFPEAYLHPRIQANLGDILIQVMAMQDKIDEVNQIGTIDPPEGISL